MEFITLDRLLLYQYWYFMLNKSRHPVNALSRDYMKTFWPGLRLEKSNSKGEQIAQEIVSLYAGRAMHVQGHTDL